MGIGGYCVGHNIGTGSLYAFSLVYAKLKERIVLFNSLY